MNGELQPGAPFAGYRIEGILGRGGMSVVYLATHIGLDRKVALKVLAPQLAADQRFRDRFVRESQLAASIDHPNVIPIYEAGEAEGQLFIAMRYVEGTDLRALLHEEGPLDGARAIGLLRQVASALDAAHAKGLVHRDVKPANVLLAKAGSGEHAYLSDFGLTKRAASESGVTGTGQFVGTLDYAAPEQFEGRSLDARTDIYSLGCVLYECLAGRPPFRRDSDAAVMYAHLLEQALPVTGQRPAFPAAIDDVIAHAMAKAPDDRYASAGDFALAATEAVGLEPGEFRTINGRNRKGSLRRLRDRPRTIALIAVALLATITLVAVLLPRVLGGEHPETFEPGTILVSIETGKQIAHIPFAQLASPAYFRFR